MKSTIKYLMTAFLALAACTPEAKPGGDDEGKEYDPIPVERTSFAKGADISWVTQMENQGMKFYGSDGKEMECTALMKSIGMNAIRLRVWVSPKDGWCSKEDVLSKAKRAKALGMDIMIDFHYSDSWADPSKQVIPSAWAAYNATQLSEAVSSHTKDVLNALKSNNINIKWAQVGNEVDSGMLHPLGNISSPGNIPNFANFVNAGYKAVKEVYPKAAVILHRSNGQETDGFAWLLNVAQAQNIKYDMIGMSLYPTWWENGKFVDWRPAAGQCIANIERFSAAYGKPVMICEIGLPVSEPQMSKEALSHVIEAVRGIKACHGVFYWEPQAPAGYNGGYDKGAFADGKPTAALDPFKN